MSDDGLPSDDQVRRIEHGVMDRIDARRALRNRVIGSVTAVVLVGGGFGLLAGGFQSSGAGTSSGSIAASGAGSSAASVAVRCALGAGSDTSRARTVRVPEGGLPQSAVAACTGGSVDFQSGTGAIPKSAAGTTSGSSAPAAPPSPSGTAASGAAGDRSATAAPSLGPAGVLCTDADGSLVVLSFSGSASATCVKAGMEPYTR